MMSLQKNLRVALVYLTLSVVGCFSELPVVGDASGKNYLRRVGETLQLENTNSVNPQSRIPMRDPFQRNLAAFRSYHQPSRINLVPYSQRSYSNTKKTSFSYIEPRNPMDVTHDYAIQLQVNSGNNLELTGDRSNAKNRYAFQGVQENPNVFNFTRRLKSTSGINSAPGIIKKEGLVNGMYVPKVYTSGEFSKAEMHSQSSQPFDFNVVEVQKNISVQPVIRPGHTKRISTDYMFRNVNHDMRQKNNGSILNDNIPAATTAMSKPQAFTKSHSDGIQSILPLKKANIFSYLHDQVGQQDYNSNFSPKAHRQSSFESTNVSINAFKGFQHDSQDAYQNGGRSQDPTVQDFHSQRKYDNLAEGASAIRSPAANIARSYKGLPSETSSIQTIRQKLSTASNGKAIHRFPRIQLAKTRLVISKPETTEVKTKIKLPATVPSSLWMSSQHSTGRGKHLISSGRSTAQSLFIKNPVVDDTMKISQSISQSVSGTQGTQNSDRSTSQNRPYYLTSKMPNTFKGFTFFPTEQAPARQTETYSGPKRPQSSFSNGIPYGLAHPRTALSVAKEEKHLTQAQNPLISNSLTKVHGKQSGQDPFDAVRVSSTNTSKHHRVIGQVIKASLVYPSSTLTPENTGSNNQAFYLQNKARVGYNSAKESQFNERPLETSRRLAPAKNTQAFTKNQTVLSLWESSQATTSERSLNGRFARPNTYRNLFMKSSNVSSVRSSASNVLNTYISTVATNANTFPEFPSVYRKTGLSQGADFTHNIQLPTRHGPINDETVSLKPEKFNSDKILLSHLVPSTHRYTVANKVTGYPLNAGVQPQSSDVQKNIEANPTMNRNASELTQLNTNESHNVMGLRPTSSVVIGRRVEANKEGENSANNSIYAVPTLQSAIYRSASIHEANSSAKPVYLPTIHRSVIKPYGKAKISNAYVGPDLMKNETWISVNRNASGMDIDLSAVGLSKTFRPTSSFVVGKFVKALEKASTKVNLNASQTNGLQYFKPARFVDIAGSASFSNVKPSFSAVFSKIAHMSFQNISTSTPGMDESVTELPFAMTADSFTVISHLQENIENDLQSTVSISNPGFMPTAVTTDHELSFPEVTAAPQTTVYSSELEPDPGNQTTQALDTSQTVLGLWKSSQATTSERSINGRFARPNTYRNLFMKSSNVSSVRSSASNVLNTYISTVATNANTFPEFPSVYRKTGLSQGADFTHNIQLPTRHGPINDETVSLKPEKFNSDKILLSHLVPSTHRYTVANKVTGYPLNAGVQPQSSDVQKNIKANPTMNRNASELTQLNTNESHNVMGLRPTSSVVIGRRVEANKEGENSAKNSIYAVPTLQSAIYRSASIHEANSSAKPVYLPTIQRSVIKPYGKAEISNAYVGPDLMKNETWISVNRSASGMDIDLSAVGLSKTLRPTSSFVVGKFVKALEKASTKVNLNASQTNGLQNFKPARLVDIAGSASFSNVKPSFSAVFSKIAHMSFQNISTSTPGMDESVTELPFAMTADSFTVISHLQENIENDLQSTVSISNPGFMPTAVTTDHELSFPEVTAAPQTTVYSSMLEPDPGNQTTQALDTSQTVLGLWKSSQATTSERSINGRFAKPNTYRNLFVKSNNVSSVSSSTNNALNTYISTVATGATNANTFPEFPSVYRKTGLSKGVDFTRNIQLPTRHRSVNDETVSLKPEKFNSDKILLSHLVPSTHRYTVANKVTGYPLNAGVQPQSSDVQKNIKANPTMNRNASELTQLNTNESHNVMGLRPTSSVVIGRRVEANKEGENSAKNSIYAVPTLQSAIYRSASIHEANSSAKPVYLPTIHRSVIKPYGKAEISNAYVGPDLMKNETWISVNRSASGMDIDLSAVGLSKTLRPTSSFVVGKFVKALEKASTKVNLNASQTNGLQNFKPARLVDIAGSASFSNVKPSFSAVFSKIAHMSFQNISTSTPGMDESVTELPFAMTADSFTVISHLQENIENDLQSTVSISNPGFMPTAVTTDHELSFPEVTAAPQTTVYSSELEPDPGNQTTQALDTSQTVLGLWKSSQATTSERSINGRFAKPNTYRNLFVKSNNVSSVSSSTNNALNTYISTVATGATNANTFPEFPSVYRKTGLSKGVDFTRNIQLPTRHRSVNDETVSLKPEKFNSDKILLSHLVPSTHRSTVANTVTGYPLNAGVQPQSSDVQKNIKANPTMNRNASELTQLNTNESHNVMGLRPTSSVVIGRRVEADKEGEYSAKNSIYAVPTLQSAIYRSASIHEANSSAKPVYLPTIHRSVIKPYGKAKIFNANVGPDLMKNETWISVNRSASGMDIDLSAVGLSKTFRPTSSFVVGKFVKALEKASTKVNLNASQTNGLQNFKPAQFVDIAGSASFSNVKPSFSAVFSKIAHMSFQNISTSTPGMDESVTELPFAMTADSFKVISDLQENIENDLQSTVSISNPGFMPTAVTTDHELSFTEVTAAPQTTVYSSELETDPGNQTMPTAERRIPFYEGILIPNTTTLVTMTSD